MQLVTKTRKWLVLILSLFALSVVTTEVASAKDVAVYAEKRMDSSDLLGERILGVHSEDIMGVDVYAVNATEVMIYLSEDGKTRYMVVDKYAKAGAYAGKSYVWKGEKWVETTDNLVPQDPNAKDDERKKNFQQANSFSYTAPPSITTPQVRETTVNNDSTNASQVLKQTKATQQYQSTLKLGQEPTSSSLLASVIMRGAGEDGMDKFSISFKELSYYATPEIISIDIVGKELDEPVYSYGSLNKGDTPTLYGNQVANTIRILTYFGWLSTNNNATTEKPWWQTILDNMSNPIYAIGAIVMVVLAVIAEPLTNIFKAFLGGASTVVSWLLPTQIFGFATVSLVTYLSGDEAKGWFPDIVKSFITQVFGTGSSATLLLLLSLVLVFSISGALIAFVLVLFRKGFREAFIYLKNLVFKMAIWALGVAFMTASYELLAQGMSASFEISENQEPSSVMFNQKKFFIATNGDISVLYPDIDFSVLQSSYLDEKYIKENFAVDGERIKQANARVEAILGSELSAELDIVNQDNGVFGEIVSNETWDVNDYLTGIGLAGELGTNTASNSLPAPLSWSGGKMTVAVSPTLTGFAGESVQNEIKAKDRTFDYRGLPVWFDSTSSSTKSTENHLYVTAGGWNGIKYSDLMYKPIQISRSAPRTYLYGASEDNNLMTINASNYTFGSANTLIGDLTTAPVVGKGVEGDEEVKRVIEDNAQNSISYAKIDGAETKGYKITTKELQWRNAYMIAMYNRYAGTATYGGGYNAQFSNQSTLFLLQSTYGANKLSYAGTNTPNSKTDMNKAQTKGNVYLSTHVAVGDGNGLANQLTRTSAGKVSEMIITYGITVAVFTFGAVAIVKDSWVYFGRWFGKGSVTGLFMVAINLIYYLLFFCLASMVSFAMTSLTSLITAKVSSGDIVQTMSTIFISFVFVGMALLVTLRLFKINGRKINFIGVFFMALNVLYDSIKEFAEKLDEALYGKRGKVSSTVDTVADEAVSRGVGRFNPIRRGGFFRNALGAFAGQAGADMLDLDGTRQLGQGTAKEDLSGSEQTPTRGGNKIPVAGNVLPTKETNTKGAGFKNKLTKPLKPSMAHRLATYGAVAGIGFTPLGGLATAYIGARGAVKAYQGAKNLGNTIKNSNLGQRIGLAGREMQLMNQYGLSNRDELVNGIMQGSIKPRANEQANFDRFVGNHNKIREYAKENDDTAFIEEADRYNSLTRPRTGFSGFNFGKEVEEISSQELHGIETTPQETITLPNGLQVGQSWENKAETNKENKPQKEPTQPTAPQSTIKNFDKIKSQVETKRQAVQEATQSTEQVSLTRKTWVNAKHFANGNFLRFREVSKADRYSEYRTDHLKKL